MVSDLQDDWVGDNLITASQRAEHACRESLTVLVKRWRKDASFNPRDTSPGYRYGLEKCAAQLEDAIQLLYGGLRGTSV